MTSHSAFGWSRSKGALISMFTSFTFCDQNVKDKNTLYYTSLVLQRMVQFPLLKHYIHLTNCTYAFMIRRLSNGYCIFLNERLPNFEQRDFLFTICNMNSQRVRNHRSIAWVHWPDSLENIIWSTVLWTR